MCFHSAVLRCRMNSWNFFGRALSGLTSRIYLVTWNVNSKAPPEDMTDLLQLDSHNLPDIYAIGLQEVAAHDWVSVISSALRKHNFVKVKYRRLQSILTVMYVKRPLLAYVCNVESEITKTGFSGYWGNKGGCSLRMDFMGMNLIVVNCHLAAHMEEVMERIVNVDMILDNQKFKDPDTDNIMDHDYVFWMGDMNFRIENTSYQRALDLVQEGRFSTLLTNDQLSHIREEGLVFEQFNEEKITFPPTYKFDPGTDTYDTSPKQRVPAFTDRILYHFHDTSYGTVKLNAKGLEYRSHPAYKMSDHKPVSAIIEFNVLTKGISSPVIFKVHAPTIWDKRFPQDVVYMVKKNFKVLSNDWVGIFSADFDDFESYLTYVWAAQKPWKHNVSTSSECMKVQFTSSVLNDLPDGLYTLCYMTKKGSLCGISEQISIESVKVTDEEGTKL